MGAHNAVTDKAEVSNTGRFAAIVAGIAIAGGIGVVEAAPAQAASLLDNIAHCESGGNPSVVNASGHGGLFQFAQTTWESVGGTGTPQTASIAEQYKRAALLLARDGTGPWLASEGCWSKLPVTSGNTIPTVKPTPYKRTTVAPKTTHVTPKHTVAPKPTVSTPIHDELAKTTQITPSTTGSYQVKSGDTLSQIAEAHGVSTQTMFNLNRNQVSNPNLIYPGQVFRTHV